MWKYNEVLKKSFHPSSNSVLVPDLFLNSIRELLSKRTRHELKYSSYIPAAVMLLVYTKYGKYHMHLHKRSDFVDRHKGEIAFPGGVQESDDNGPLETALRETHEEIAILPEDITILGQMDDLVTTSGYLINVFVGTIPYPYHFIPNRREINEVLEIPLKVLYDSSNIRQECYWNKTGNFTHYSYAYKHHIIYGATAKIISQFLSIANNATDVSRA